MAFIHNVTGDHLGELTEVSFKGNALVSLSPNTLIWNMIQELDFSDNPWRCDCNLKWIVNLTVNERTEENYVCKQPYKHFNQRIKDMTEDDFSCSFFENDVFIVGGCLLIILTMTGLTSIGFLVAKLKIIPKIFSVFSSHPKVRARAQAGSNYSRVDPCSVETVVSVEYHMDKEHERRRKSAGATPDSCSSDSCPPSQSSRSSCCSHTRIPRAAASPAKKTVTLKDPANGIACTKV